MNKRTIKFKEALKEWDAYRDKVGEMRKAKIITKEEVEKLLAEKARELDL